MKSIISVGAGNNQTPLIKRLKEHGYRIIAFDLNSNAPGKEFCDYFQAISTWDYHKAIYWLESLGFRYNGVGCFSYGKALVTQAQIANHFNLPMKMPEELISLNANKNKLRKILTQNKFSTLKEFLASEIKEKSQVLAAKQYVLKPLLGGSSQGIKLIDSKQIKTILGKQKLDGDLIIQEYLTGQEFRLVSIIQDSSPIFTAVLAKQNLDGTFFTSRLIPTHNETYWAIPFIKSIVSLLNIKHSILKLDVIKNSSRIEILELDFGIPGDYFETYISPLCYNYNFIDNYIKLILGQNVDRHVSQGKYSCFDYLYSLSSQQRRISLKNLTSIAHSIVGDPFTLITTKNLDHNKVAFPKSNTDNICAIIHNNVKVSNSELNLLINQKLSL